MGKRNVVYTYSGSSFSLKKRKVKLTPAVTWMNLEDMTLSEISRSQKNKYCVIPLLLVCRVVNPETESQGWFPGAGEREMGSKFFEKINLFIYLWLHWVFVALRGLSLVAASGGYSSLRCASFSLWRLLLLWSTGSRHVGFSSCGTPAH